MLSETAADLVLTGGRIFTADAAKTWAEALAVRGGRIAAVGGDRDVRALVGPGARVIELRGRTVTPGFGDSHVHPPMAGLARIRCELHGLRGLDEYLAAVAAYTGANPDVEWITGGGWSLADFPGGLPRREDLDRVCPDRPIFLPNRDGHDAWVNSAALDRAGISAATADPDDGRIARDPDGTPSGTLHEGAMALVERLIPTPTADDLRRATLESQRYLHSLGITNWQDAWVTPVEEAAYRSLGASGELTARVVGGLWWERDEGLGQIESLVERRARGPVGRFSPTSVKLMVDGIVENQTASMTEPYLDVARPRDRQPGQGLHRPGGAQAGRRATRRPRVPAPLPCAGRPGRAPCARRGRGGPAGQRLVRHPAPPRPPPGRPSRRPAPVPAGWGRWRTRSRTGRCWKPR